MREERGRDGPGGNGFVCTLYEVRGARKPLGRVHGGVRSSGRRVVAVSSSGDQPLALKADIPMEFPDCEKEFPNAEAAIRFSSAPIRPRTGTELRLSN